MLALCPRVSGATGSPPASSRKILESGICSLLSQTQDSKFPGSQEFRSDASSFRTQEFTAQFPNFKDLMVSGAGEGMGPRFPSLPSPCFPHQPVGTCPHPHRPTPKALQLDLHGHASRFWVLPAFHGS